MRMNWLARLKTFLARRMALIEFCHRCGRRQPLVWWCQSNRLWADITGWHGNGILCPECFDRLARKQGRLLRFVVTEIVESSEQADLSSETEQPPPTTETSEPRGSFRADTENVPTTVYQAAAQLAASYDANAVDYLRSLTREEVVGQYRNGREVIISRVPVEMSHFAGMELRNNWNLWQTDSPVRADAIQRYQIAHADDVSALIFEWSYAIVRNESFDPVNYCHTFHIHWAQYNRTSLQAAGL